MPIGFGVEGPSTTAHGKKRPQAATRAGAVGGPFLSCRFWPGLRPTSDFQKFSLTAGANQFTDSHRLVPQRGVRTLRTWGGMRWTWSVRLTSVLQRTAKSCGSDAPTPASSLREDAQATVSNKRGHREEREVSRKTIARGMPGRSGVTVVTMLVCFFHLHARLRAHRAPGIPCAL